MSLHLSKCHIEGNHMSRLKYVNMFVMGIIGATPMVIGGCYTKTSLQKLYFSF